jgi:DNA-binding Lrp family transcriptional regulator
LISEVERKILAEIQDMPLVREPFNEVANRLGMDEDEVLNICQNLIKRGIIRRFGPSISHRRFGYMANPMTVLKVPKDKLDEVGNIIASESDVTHCYARSGWDYNLFFMIHSKDRKIARKRAQEIVKKTGIEDFRILFSVRELKKISFQIPKGSESQKAREVNNETSHSA